MAEEQAIDSIDLSSKGLKKLDKAVGDQNHATVLILDDNELQRLDNVGTYLGLQKLSAVRNQLIRMYGVSKLQNLASLNLAHNNLVGIEGLKELVNLRWLCLSGNNVKAIDHLNTNINLEHLDLSENNIGCISDLSHLQNLKELLLHGNRISSLQFCQKYLPMSLESLSLADNRIADLNEVSHVSHLPVLREFTIAGNPCVAAATAVATHPHTPGQCVGFDYRPFVINWCMNLRVLDGYIVDAKESLRAEWLYSQGKGRSFRVGEQEALIVYLSSVCPPLPSSSSSHPAKGLRPASAGSLGNSSIGGATPDSASFPPQSSSPLSEEDRKLLLILSKAQLHQKELREQNQQKTDKSDVSSVSSGYGMSSSFTSVRSSSVGGSIQPTLEECETSSNIERGSKQPLDNGMKSRPSTAGPSFASPIVRRRTAEPPQRGSPKRCSSRSSCSREQQHQLHRRFSSTIGDMATSSSYNVELPVTLYGEESSVDMVTSLDGGGRGGIGTWGGRSSKTFRANGEKENLMTRSLDPSLLSCSDNDTEKSEPVEPPLAGSLMSFDEKPTHEPPRYKPMYDFRSVWNGDVTSSTRSYSGEDISSMGSSHRPKKLFSQSRVAGDSGIMDSTALKEDGNLEEFSEEGIQNPLQTATKLVPVPESIVSPEYRPATSYMPTTTVRQGHMSSVSAEPERRRAQGWGTDRVPPRSSSTSSHCFNHPQQNYFPAGNYSMNSTIPPQNMVGSSCNVPAGPSSSPGTRRANQNQQQHSSCSSSEASRCRHQHQNTNSSANVGANSSSVPTRGPPPVPSYFPASTSSNSTNAGSSRHSCNISSFYHNQVQSSQTDCQSKNLQRTRRSNSRTTGDTSTPHSPAMSRVRRIPTSGRGIGAKIRKPAEGESVRGGSSRASRGGAHGKSEKEGDIEGRESSGDNSDSEMSISKLEAIKCVAVERRHRKEDGSADLKDEKPIIDNPEKIKAAQEKAALKIQSLWRGYRYRKESKVDKSDEAPVDYQSLKEEIQSMRVEDHIRLLSSELEATRGELGKERKLRLQQMEAIKALWKEVYSLQPRNVVNGLQSPNDEGVNLPTSSVSLPSVDGKEQPALVDAKIVAELTRTCANLQGQVQQLSESLQQVMQHISPHKAEGEINRDERVANTNAAIQTYISAVLTPQGPCASFPFGFKEEGEKKAAETQANSDCRPSYLPIFEERVKKVLKRPSEEGNDSEGHLEEENEVSEAKERDYEEPPSQEVKHYVEGLVDGVLKAVFSAEEEETERSGCNVQCPVVLLSNEKADDK